MNQPDSWSVSSGANGRPFPLHNGRGALSNTMSATGCAVASSIPHVAGTDAPEWSTLADSAARFLDTAEALADDELRAASALPGWTRAHVLTHVTQATDSRTGLLLAARAGRVGRQYPSEQARAGAIDAGARRPARAIQADLHRAVEECLAAIGDHPGQLWDAPAIWLGDRHPVRGVVPGLRRELEFHHVDLAAGYQPADWPDDFVATLLPLVAGVMNRRTDAPPMTLTGPTTLHVGTGPSATVTGTSAALLAWLSGRGDGRDLHLDGTTLPAIPPLG